MRLSSFSRVETFFDFFGVIRPGRFIMLGVVLMLLLLWPVPAQANSAPPPSVIWFMFVDQTSAPVNVDAVQLVGCDSLACAQPVLLQQYGQCQLDGCLQSSPQLNDWSTSFDCAGNRCRSTAFNYPEGYFKLIAQFSGRANVSDVSSGLPTDYWQKSPAWQVSVSETGLSLTPTAAPEYVDKSGLFLTGLAGTQLIELIIAAAFLGIWLKTDRRRLAGLLGTLFLVNLTTLPVVWFFFPSLGQFQPASARTMGAVVLIVALLYAGLLVWIYRAGTRRWRVGLIVATVVSLPLTFFCGLLMLFASAYGNYHFYMAGWPGWATVTASEVFAVVAETALMTLLSRGSLSWRQAGLMCLLTNTASFAWGVVVLGI